MDQNKIVLTGLATLIAIFATNITHAEPALAKYYTQIPPHIIDSSYSPPYVGISTVEDLNNDGFLDLILLGADYPINGATTYSPKSGRVFFGTESGDFILATEQQFPISTLNTIHPRKILFADFNNDGRNDMFISSHGWDTNPFPGEQNRLYLSQLDGSWIDATSKLAQLSDYSHTSAVGDINGDGSYDIFVGNGYPGQNQFLPYTLLNQGGGNFIYSNSNIPVGKDQGLDILSGHLFPGASLIDLDGDGLSELIITPEATEPSFNKLTQTTIYWNNHGFYSDTNKTLLAVNTAFPSSHIDLDARAIDVNADGLPDLVVCGTQGKPFYDGWFVQIFINKGNHQFVDETALRLLPTDRSGGTTGIVTNTPWPQWVKPIDFNNDGYSDFFIQFSGSPTQSLPLVWINDGSGHFTTLKVSDFINPGDEWMMLGALLAKTKHGYSFFTTQMFPGSGGLVLTGLLANQPYRTPATGVKPQNGWWWNPSEPGRGFFIETKNNRFFAASYLYDDTSAPIWFASGPSTNAHNSITGNLDTYIGGQTLNGTWKPASAPTSAGSMNITFSDATHGTMSWAGKRVPIVRFEIGPGSLNAPPPTFQPETGWWWNASESGRGFSIEVQGNQMFIAGFMYDSSGKPIWYVSSGQMTAPNLYVGTWSQYGGGQTLTGSWKQPTITNNKVGSAIFSFDTTTTGTLQLPDGRKVMLTRFAF